MNYPGLVDPVDDNDLLRRFLAGSGEKGASRENAIVFPKRFLDRPIGSGGDAQHHLRIASELSDLLCRREKRLDLVTALKAWIAAALCRHTSIDIEDAAGDFGMSLRSFQRKLAECGVNYAELRNLVRMEIAKSLLTNTRLSIPVITDQLGYSELSAFARSFRHLTGFTPARFRDAARNQERPRRNQERPRRSLTEGASDRDLRRR
ncbi:helix-turn-helix transcriptional regulator [Rhizobium mongolense]|uniref:helix-turn-helix transcriptional regulator n=1 Tax=Rhizobium mongolense TaxID=57676 RepID=UPI0034A336E4